MAKVDVTQQPNLSALNRRRSSEIEHINRIRGATSNRQLGKYSENTPSEDRLKHLSSSKTDVFQQPNSRLLNRRRSSENEHINRIRGASSNRQLSKYWNVTPSKDYANYVSSRKSDKAVSSKSRRESTSHKNSMTEKSPHYFKSTDFEHKESRGLPHQLGETKSTQRPSKQSELKKLKRVVGKSRKVTRRPTHSSWKTGGSHENPTSEQSLDDLNHIQFNKSDSDGFLGNSEYEYRRTSQQQESDASDKNFKKEVDNYKKVTTKETWGSLSDSEEKNLTGITPQQEAATRVNKQQKSDADEENFKKQAHESRKVTRKGAHNSMNTGSSENSSSDLSLEDLGINKSENKDSKGFSDISGEMNSTQRISKQIESNTEEQNLKKKDDKPRIVIRRRSFRDIGNKGVSKKSLVTRILPSRKEINKRTQREIHPTDHAEMTSSENEQESDEKRGIKGNENTSEEQSIESVDAEMFLTELGKLQIVLDAKCLSPQHAAVIVWLDRSASDNSGSLSLSGSRQLDFLQRLKSEYVPPIDAMPTPNKNAVLPFVTILKNLAVRSETEQ